MGYSATVLHSAQARLAARRSARLAQQEERRREIFRTLPRAAEIDRLLQRTMAQVVAAALREEYGLVENSFIALFFLIPCTGQYRCVTAVLMAVCII